MIDEAVREEIEMREEIRDRIRRDIGLLNDYATDMVSSLNKICNSFSKMQVALHSFSEE